MGVVVEVSPVVERGTGAGGEDFYLEFTCVVEAETLDAKFIPKDQIFKLHKDDVDGVNVENDGNEIKYWTQGEEFEWEGTNDDAAKLFNGGTLTHEFNNIENWELFAKNGIKYMRFVSREFVDGNAD